MRIGSRQVGDFTDFTVLAAAALGGEGNGMSVSILAVDEVDVADMFRQQFRREVRQGQYVLHFA